MAIKLRINPPAASELKRLRQLGAERRQFLDELEAAPVSRETLAAAGTTAVSAAAAARAAALTAARAAQEAEQALQLIIAGCPATLLSLAGSTTVARVPCIIASANCVNHR